MPRTITPEEQERAQDIPALKNIKPTPKRKVFVDSDGGGEPNIFIWISGGDASKADGSEFVESSRSTYGLGGANEGVWKRVNLPFETATTDDLSEGTENIYFTGARTKDEFQVGGDLVYDPSTGKISLDVSSLSASKLFGTKTTDDLPKGSDPQSRYFGGEDTREAFITALDAPGIEVTYDEEDPDNFGEPTITLDGVNTGPDVTNVDTADNQTLINENVPEINFQTGIGALNSDGVADVPLLEQFGSATFSGDGEKLSFDAPHGLDSEPTSVQVTPTTDDASSISHVQTDATNITVVYDSPPPSGTDNIKINFKLKVQLNQAPFWEDKGDLLFSF